MKLQSILLTLIGLALCSPTPKGGAAEITAISNCIWQKNTLSYSFSMRWFDAGSNKEAGIDEAGHCGFKLYRELKNKVATPTDL